MYVGFLEVLRGRAVRQPMEIIGHMAETPRIILDNGRKYMVFSLTEAAETEFRLKVLPTTPMRRKGDRVVVTYDADNDGVVIADAMHATR